MYRKIRRELSMKNTTVARCICGRKPEKIIISLRETFLNFTNTHIHTTTAKQTREIMYTKKNLRRKRKKEEEEKCIEKSCLRKLFLRGGLGRCRRREKAQGIDRSKEMHTHGEFYLNNQPQSRPVNFFHPLRNLKFGDGLRWRAKTH